MQLQSKAQSSQEEILMVEDHGHDHSHENIPAQIVLTPISPPVELEVIDQAMPEAALEVTDHLPSMEEPILEVFEIGGEDGLPGLVEKLNKDKEADLEVSDEPEKDKDKDENDARKKKMPKDHWDWEAKGHEGFLEWIKERFSAVPKHSGYDSSGLERAISYLEKLDNEISKAMRLDLDGKLDADKIEDVRSKIEDGIERLEDRIEKVKRKGKKKKTSEFSTDEALVKEAQKAAGVRGIYVMAPLFISCIARICINGYVSAGHDMEGIFKKLSSKYKLNEREKMETIQLLSDMGFPVRQDRGMLDEEVDITSSDNVDWAANYKG